MSLHSKIIGWFAVFAALTLIAFSLGDHVLFSRSLSFALDTRAAALARQAAVDAEHRYGRAETELLVLGHVAAAGAAEAVPPLSYAFSYVRVTRDGSPLYETSGSGAAVVSEPTCAAATIDFDLHFDDSSGRPLRVVAAVEASVLFADLPTLRTRLGEKGLTALFHSETGLLLHDPDCAIDRSEAPVRLKKALARRVVEAAGAGMPPSQLAEVNETPSDSRVLAAARTSAQPWSAVVVLDQAEFAAPFMKLRRQYFVVMGSVLLLALLLVVAGIRRDMRRLAAISSAADAIGHGQFNVWLPPPTGDEIGRVSLALGRMAERLASSLRQIEVSRSMAAVGELSTYLSHEIRNPLSSIRLNLQMLRRDLKTGSVPEDGEELVGLCLSELQRLDDVVRTVLELGRPGRAAVGSSNAHQVVDETLGMMRRKLADRGVDVTLQLAAAESGVGIDSAALRGVLLNLMLNSLDALAESRSPRIRIRSQVLESHGRATFELRVADNGPGIPPQIRQRVFDPFFTTKQSGNGIGLPTAMRAVQECGGVLRYEAASEAGGGAEFVVELPLDRSATKPPQPRRRAARDLIAAGTR